MILRYPNLYLAGAPKCGTTSLFDWLVQHPGIYGPVVKEPILFRDGLSIEHSLDEAERLAPYRNWREEPYALEGSTHHFYSPTAAAEMKSASPAAKVIICLRNPALATHSMYHQLRYTGAEDVADFETALALEDQRASVLAPIARGVAESRLYSRVFAYRQNISRYLDTFGRDNVRVILLDDLKSEPRQTLEHIFDWLGLATEPARTIDVRSRNGPKDVRSRALLDLALYPPRPVAGLARAMVGPIARRRATKLLRRWATKPKAANPALSQQVFHQLVRRHEGDIAWLEEFLGRELGHWRQFQSGKFVAERTGQLPQIA
tara:strand:+ start:62 stop:1018 length:957 start_codon:yes stop_codon:yes gene_type:complete